MSILLRKVTALASAITILSSALGTTFVSAASDGFLPFAKALANNSTKIIELQSSDSAYRAGDNITRAEAAGIALGLKEVSLPANYICKGTFSDVSATRPNSWACRAAELAADNGIAAKNNTFRPSDNITRAEALAMILKATGVAITATTDSTFRDSFSASWQRDVANAALVAGIASSNAYFNPNNNITRGEFFVFAYNSGKKSGVVTTDKADYEEDLGLGDIIGGDTGTGTTSTGTTSTGTTSTGITTPTAAGTLTVALNPTSPANGTQVPKNGIVRFAVVDFSAGGSDISLSSVQINKAGLATINSSDRVWFEKNGVRVSGKTSFTSDNNAVISFAPSYVVKAGTTESLDLYVQLNENSGNDFQFASSTISSSALSVSGNFLTPILRTADYTVATATIAPTGSNLSYNASNDPVELAKFTVTNSDTNSDTRDLRFQSITLYQSGNANLTSISNVTVERNGIVVSSGAVVSGKAMTLMVNDTIRDGASAIYTVKAVIINVDQSTDTYQFYVKNTSDVTLTEVNSAFRANITSTTPINSNLYSISGGDVKFERDTSVSLSTTAAPGTDQTVLMQGTITAKSPVTLEDVTLGYTLSNGATITGALNTVYLQIGGSTFTWTPAAGNATFLGTATVSGTVPVKMYAKLKDTATGTIKFNSLDINSFTTKQYVTNQNNVSSAIGNISGVTVSVGASNLNVTRTDSLGNSSLASGSKGVLVYGARFSSTQGNPVSISNLSVTTSGSALSYTGGNTSLTLFVNGVARSTKSLNTNIVTFDNFNATVSTSTPTDIQIKADFSDVTTTGSFQVSSITYDAVDNVTSIAVAKPTVAGATFTIATAVGTLSTASSSPLRQLLQAGSMGQKLVAFTVEARNDSINLKDITLTGANLDALSNIRLTDVNLNTIGYASSVTATGASFQNLDNQTGSLISLGGATKTTSIFYVVADVNQNTDVTGVVVYVVAAGSNIKSSNGSVISMSGSVVTSNAHDVVQNAVKITKIIPTTNTPTTNAIGFSIANLGANQVTLSGATFSTNLSGYTGSSLEVRRTSDDQLVGSISAVSGTVTFTANNTIDKEQTVNYYVKLPNLSVTAQARSWSISLTNLEVNTGVLTVDLANYPNNVNTLGSSFSTSFQL